MNVNADFRWPAGEGSETVWWIGLSRLAIKVRSEQLSMWEWQAPRGAVTPFHVHSREDEGFFVVDGRWRFVLQEQRIDAVPGDLVMLPRGIPHAYGCLADGRVLSWATPGGMEQMFVEAGAPAEGPPAAPEPPRIGAAGAAVGIEVIGPPPALD